MIASRRFWLTCDRCQRRGPACTVDGSAYGSARLEAIRQLARQALDLGWLLTEDGDLCPTCVPPTVSTAEYSATEAPPTVQDQE